MWDAFKRADDLPKFSHSCGISSATTPGLCTEGDVNGNYPELDASAATLAGMLRVGSVGGLSSQNMTGLDPAVYSFACSICFAILTCKCYWRRYCHPEDVVCAQMSR